MILQGDDATLEIVLGELVPAGRPDAGDLRLMARLTSGEFTGCNDSAWVSASMWQSFLTELRRVEEQRSGEARVLSMSPSDFALRIFVRDRAGHVAAEGHVGKDLMWSTGAHAAHIPFRMELDPSTLLLVLSRFRDLGSDR
jgi:hypothetical protein